ncbi:hypothetical protein [Mycolicibacterium iranicum]|uniref:Uncharacterized protein n=1 Tax=Mycolicibacterium iranicum TaxID=912594 RepID=A0A178LVE2_MYCIR|nr:hypothetical protein [Mycolicibacterium iranicum]OAN37514.1 hypothetical protein A4X20_22545 [Mycolicibacterium iranicum]
MSVVISVSWVIAAAAIALGVAAVTVFRQPLLALRVMLELLTAAGLLRLSVEATWVALAGVAMLIAVRKMVTRSLAADLTAPPWRAPRTT